MRCFLFMCSSARLICSSDLLICYIFCSLGKKRCLLFQLFFFFPFPSPIRHRSSLLFTRISARLKHSLSLQTKINDMNTSSYVENLLHQSVRLRRMLRWERKYRILPTILNWGEKVPFIPKRCSRAASKAERERTTNENDWKESTGYERFRSRVRCGALEVERAEGSRKA